MKPEPFRSLLLRHKIQLTGNLLPVSLTAMEHVGFSFPASQRDDFTFGDCWRLAKALNYITGWKMAAIVCDNQESKGVIRDWCHMGNITPEGKFIDITGISEENYVLEEWATEFWEHCKLVEEECHIIRPITTQEWDGMTEEQEPLYDDYDPLTTAQEVLAAYVAHQISEQQELIAA